MKDIHVENRIEKNKEFLCEVVDCEFIGQIEKTPIMDFGSVIPSGYHIKNKYRIGVKKALDEGNYTFFFEDRCYMINECHLFVMIDGHYIYDIEVSATI
jgi:hypothetical protein